MAYEKTVWKNNEAPKINATNLNKMENGIANAVETDSIARVSNVVSRNLANADNYVIGHISTTGAIEFNNDWAYTKVLVEPNTQYTYQFTSNVAQQYEVAQYQNDGTFIVLNHGNFESGTQSFTFTTENNAGYVLVAWRNDLNHSNIQVEKGSTATPYTPYLNMQELEKNSIINNYSTGEQVIGTWIDGKPLYRKVIQPVIVIGANAIVSVPHGISNLSQVLKVDATLFWGNKTYPFPAIYEDLSKQVAINYIDSTNVYIKSFGENWSTQITTIILEYTKTTD